MDGHWTMKNILDQNYIDRQSPQNAYYCQLLENFELSHLTS